MAECSIAVFDLGGVLIDWNPRYLYRKLFDGDTEAMEEFLATVCTQSWNEQQDAGRSFADDCRRGQDAHVEGLALLRCLRPQSASAEVRSQPVFTSPITLFIRTYGDYSMPNPFFRTAPRCLHNVTTYREGFWEGFRFTPI